MARGDPRTCPGCGDTKPEEEWPVDVKDLGKMFTTLGTVVQVTSVGFRCPDCGTTWGHGA